MTCWMILYQKRKCNLQNAGQVTLKEMNDIDAIKITQAQIHFKLNILKL